MRGEACRTTAAGTCPARRCLRQAIQIVRAKRPFAIPAFVLLPDHLHALWTLPHGDSDYSTRWRRIKEEFTQAYLAEGGLELERNRLAPAT